MAKNSRPIPESKKGKPDYGCLIAAAVFFTLFFLWGMFMRSLPPGSPSDDPYYDAPVGGTRGGDTY